MTALESSGELNGLKLDYSLNVHTEETNSRSEIFSEDYMLCEFGENSIPSC